MEKVAKNVFLNEDPEQFVNCWKVPRVSLKPWTGTDNLFFYDDVKLFFQKIARMRRKFFFLVQEEKSEPKMKGLSESRI